VLPVVLKQKALLWPNRGACHQLPNNSRKAHFFRKVDLFVDTIVFIYCFSGTAKWFIKLKPL
jgi:hypothetical protein